MVTRARLQTIALSFPEVTEEAHFEKSSFRVKKKIFATYDDALKRVCIKLSEIDQHVFTSMALGIVYPVDNKWGKQGWTYIELQQVEEALLEDALSIAYCEVAPEKLARQVRPSEEM